MVYTDLPYDLPYDLPIFGTMMGPLLGGVSRDGSPLKKVPSKNSEKSSGSTPSYQNHQKQSGDVQGNLGGYELETGEDR